MPNFNAERSSTTCTYVGRRHRTSWWSPVAFLAWGLLLPFGEARAGAPPNSPAAAVDVACEREASAIERSACSVANALPAEAHEALVVVTSATAGDGRALLPASVSERLAQRVAARLGPRTASASGLPLSEALHAAGGVRGLIYLRPALYRGRLDIGVDWYGSAGRFWQRLRAPGLLLKRHALLSGPLDAQLRALFPAIPVLVSRVEKGTLRDHDAVALACGDVRGDGSSEIAIVGRRKVQVGNLDRGQFAARASLDWAAHSPVAPSPLREPIASAWLAAPGRLWVGVSDRADALELSGALQVEQRWHGLMPWPGSGCTRRLALGYEGSARPCPGSKAATAPDFRATLDAFAGRSLADQRGETHLLRVGRPVGAESARALDSARPELALPEVGAQIAVGDLDDDGIVEVATSSPTLDRRSDQLLVRSLLDNGQARERIRLAVPSGIDAIAICASDGLSMAPLVLATGDGIWIIH